MKILILKRGKGKTTKLVQYASKHHYTIVCSNPEFIKGVAHQKNLDIPEPISYSTFIRDHWHGQRIPFVIDDADRLLQYIAGYVPIDLITLNKDNVRRFK